MSKAGETAVLLVFGKTRSEPDRRAPFDSFQFAYDNVILLRGFMLNWYRYRPKGFVLVPVMIDVILLA